MRNVLLFLTILMARGLHVSAQKIQYTRQTALMNYSDAVQLVTNISGRNHLLIFSVKQKPAIYIYDRQLQMQNHVEISFKLPEVCDIKVFPLKDFYYLYVHVPRSPLYNLWRIDGIGNIADVSDAFQDIITSTFTKNNSNFELKSINNNLYIISYLYHPDLGKISTTIVETDSTLKAVKTHRVLFDFIRGEETLQHVLLLNERDLMVLKTSSSFIRQSTLQLLKIGLDSGDVITTTFKSEGYVYTDPGFFYNPGDSSFMVYAMLRDPPYFSQVHQSVLLVHLDHQLNALAPYKLLKSQFINNTAANFLLVDGFPQRWIGFYKYRSFLFSRTGGNYPGPGDPDLMFRNSPPPGNSSLPYPYGDDRQSRRIRFTRISKELRIVNDTLALNNKNKFYVEFMKSIKFTLQNKSYLIMSQRFSSRRSGLFLVYDNNKKELATEDIRVYDKYEYLLSQLRPTSEQSIILPYINKREVGLVKIDLETLGE